MGHGHDVPFRPNPLLLARLPSDEDIQFEQAVAEDELVPADSSSSGNFPLVVPGPVSGRLDPFFSSRKNEACILTAYIEPCTILRISNCLWAGVIVHLLEKGHHHTPVASGSQHPLDTGSVKCRRSNSLTDNGHISMNHPMLRLPVLKHQQIP
jgi:hypothetical protein